MRQQNNEQKYLLWRQQEARFFDIPIMMHAKPDYSYQNQTEDSSSLIAYTTYANSNDIQVDYMSQMEKFGWRHKMTVAGYETTIIFEKPQKICIVSLRPGLIKNEIKVVITQGYAE